MLVPLLVTIGQRTIGPDRRRRREHHFPDFNAINPDLRGGMDWCYYIDQFGGWMYDKCGHADHDPHGEGEHPEYDSPRGCWLGMFLCEEPFAKRAVQLFPETCKILTETEAEKFYECRCSHLQPDIVEDDKILQVIAAKKQLGINDPKDNDALDPDHPSPGRNRNKNKKWKDRVKQRGLEVHPNFRP